MQSTSEWLFQDKQQSCPAHMYPNKSLQRCRDTARSGPSNQARQDQRRSKDRAFDPRDWEGNSADSTSSSSQPGQQQPDVPTAAPSSSSASAAGSRRDTAREANLQSEAGFEWEPTGAGRKGWYNPQSSSSSAADSGGAGFLDDPLLASKAGPSRSGQVPEPPQTASRGEVVPQLMYV